MSTYFRAKPDGRPRPVEGPGAYYRNRRLRKLANAQGGPTLDRIADHEFLIEAYRIMKAEAGRAPGPDGMTFRDLGPSEAADCLREVARAIRTGSYAPGPGRKLRIPKPGGGTRTLTICNLIDRVVSKALLMMLSPSFEATFSGRSHGFRPRRGTLTLLAALEAAMIQEGRAVLALDDVEKAFDNVAIPSLMEDLREHISDAGLLTLIEAVVRGGEDRDRAVGIAQGDPLSPLLLNVRLHKAHDVPLTGLVDQPPWFRYADNLCYPARSATEGERILGMARHHLGKAGHKLKGEDGPPVDLRTGEARLLGFTLTLRDDRLRLGMGEASWRKLALDLEGAHDATDPPYTARQVVEGWIDAFGPAFESSGTTDMERLYLDAAERGFREIASPDELRRRRDASRARWEIIRKEASSEGTGSYPS